MKKILCVTGAFFLLVLVACAFYPKRGVGFSLLNASGQPIHEVKFLYRGFTVRLDTVEPGEKRIGEIMPHAGADLMLEFKGGNGELHSKDVDIYLVKGDRGHIAITIGEHGVVERRLDIQHSSGWLY